MLYNNLIDLRTITFITKKKVIVFYGFILYELSCAFYNNNNNRYQYIILRRLQNLIH